MDADVLDKLRKAGKINADAREYGKKLVKVGASLLDVSDKIEEFILKHGGGLAFPAQLSRNDQAAHNCAAHEDKTSPIYGMPIINVDQARTVIVLKRSMNAGFAGIQNALFYKNNTRMLFGDAKQSVQALVAAFKAG